MVQKNRRIVDSRTYRRSSVHLCTMTVRAHTPSLPLATLVVHSCLRTVFPDLQTVRSSSVTVHFRLSTIGRGITRAKTIPSTEHSGPSTL